MPGYGGTSSLGAAVAPIPLSFVGAFDFMKGSKDKAPSGLTNAQITQATSLFAPLHCSHFSLSTAYDYWGDTFTNNFVAAVRAAGKNIWWRSHPLGWESGSVSPTTYRTTMVNAINAAPSNYLQPGDILDGCPEADGSPWWKNNYISTWETSTGTSGVNARQDFNAFLLGVTSDCKTALAGLGKVGITTGIHSLQGFAGTGGGVNDDHSGGGSFYLSTALSLGFVAPDLYPDGNDSDATTATNHLMGTSSTAGNLSIKAALAAYPGVKFILGEHGYCNKINQSDTLQNTVLTMELGNTGLGSLGSSFAGYNYWVGPGTSTEGNFDYLTSGSWGSFALRPAATTVSNFFASKGL